VTSKRSETVSDMVAHLAARTGTMMAFGHPGGEVVGLIGALERAGTRFILARHEAQAAFMAGGIGELTGHPGICVSTLGPGATNMVTGVASALLERAPLIAITADIAAGAPAGATHQKLPLAALYSPITKRSLTVAPDTSPEEVADVISAATTPRPGPVHLCLAADVAEQPAPGRASPGRPRHLCPALDIASHLRPRRIHAETNRVLRPQIRRSTPRRTHPRTART
jgi:acetolactate synthase I/II/III large subunit